jgi:two-component sensor histidine kinase
LADLLALPRRDLERSGQRLRTFIASEFVQRYDGAVDMARISGSADPIEVELVGTEGRIPIRIAMSRLPGDPPRLVMVVQDISEAREAEERRELMMREMEHRAKNTLAVIQAALRLGASDATDAQALARAVEARVAALGRSQSLLTTVGEAGASLRQLIEQEVAPFSPGKEEGGIEPLVLDGPDIRVTPKAAQALTMTFHELATNAAKYGAFARTGASVRVGWIVDDNEEFVLHWSETGGAAVTGEPNRTGFGTRLIDTTVLHQLDGRIERQWKPRGLALVIHIPLANMAVAAGH